MPEASFDSGSPADSFETAGRTEVFLSIGNFGCEKSVSTNSWFTALVIEEYNSCRGR